MKTASPRRPVDLQHVGSDAAVPADINLLARMECHVLRGREDRVAQVRRVRRGLAIIAPEGKPASATAAAFPSTHP